MKTLATISLVLMTIAAVSVRTSARGPGDQDLLITANFAEKQNVRPDERIELTLSRQLRSAERRIAVFIGVTDVSSLFVQDQLRFRYNAKLWPLPPGESPLTVYLVTQDDDWKEIARFTLRVNESATAQFPGLEPVGSFLK